MYEFEIRLNKKSDSKPNPYGCAMFNHFELHNVHAESVGIERLPIFSVKVDYVEYNRNVLPTNKVQFNLSEGSFKRGINKLKAESRRCKEIDFDNITEQLQTDYLERYEGFQREIHQVRQFDESSAVNTKYLGSVNMKKKKP